MALAKNKWNLGEKKKLQEGPHKERAVLIGVVQPGVLATDEYMHHLSEFPVTG